MAKKITDKSEEDFLGQIENANQSVSNFIDNYGNTNYLLPNEDWTTPRHLTNEWKDYGNSSHDTSTLNPEYKEGDLNEMRAADQGFWEKVGLGAVKMSTTAASTFLNNTVGFLWGIGETFKTGNLSTIYDNSFTNLMQDWNEWCEKEMPHYSSKYEGWGADFWGNFIGKDILQNAGFQIGTGASLLVPGAFLKVGGNALKATKMLSNFMKTGRAINTGSAAKDLIIGTYAAIGESTVEALGNKRDFVKFQNQVADDEYARQKQQLDYEWSQLVQQKYGGNEELARNSMDFNEYFYKGQDLTRQRNERKKFIDKEAEKVADMTFLANLALVGGENFVTFGKAFGGYNLNKRFGNIANDIIDSEGKVLKKNVWDSTAEDIIRSGKYKVKNENYGKLIKNEEGKWIRDERKYLEKDAKIQARAKQSSTAFNFAKVAAGEGFEEMNQEVASQYSAGIAEQDMLAYEALAKDGMAYDEILQNLNSTWFSYGEFTKAVGKVYSDPQQWRQFFGGMIGVGFSPHFTKGADGKLHFHINNLGAQNADINAKNQTNAYIAEQINNILNSPESQNYLQGMLRHKALDNVKADAITRDSKIDYEDADFAQFVSDITMMSNAGKLGLLTASLDNMRNMNDDALKETCMQLATQDKNGDTIGDFVDNNGNFLGNTDEEKLKIREKINKRIDKLQKDITLYQKAMNDIDGRTGGILDHETLAAYTWEQCNVMNKYARSKDIIGREDTQKLLGVYANRIGRSLLNYENSLKTTEDLLKGEKARIAEQPLAEGEKPKPSELQKKYESDIENLTKKINQAKELSQLLVDMKNLSVNNSDYKTDKDAIRTLFDKYSDFAKSMPFMAKQIGVLDENGNKKKIKDKNGKESDAGMSLEYLLFSKQFDLFISKYEDSQAAEIDAETKKVLKDLRDSAINYRKAILTEESLENLYEHPEEYVQQRAIFQQKVLEHTNKEAIKEITKEIKKRLNEGSIDAKNLDEKVKEIVDGIKKSKKEKRGFFKSLLNSVENTPYEQLISTAIREVLSDKKYENIKQMRDLIAYMNAAIMGNPVASSSAKRIALETFNKVLQNANSVDDILKAEVKLENFDITPLYVEETDKNKAAKWNAIKQNPNGLPYDRSNYQYTVESVTNAKIVQNEALQLFNNSRELAKQMIWSPKLRSLNETAAKNSAEFETQSKRSQREKIEKNKSTIEEDINKILDTFEDGKQLNTSEQNELIKKVEKLVNDKFNTENFDDEFKDEVERLRSEYYRKAMDMVDNNLKKRIREYYKQSDDDIETRNQIDKAFGAINKAIGKIQRQLEKNDGNEVFADAFDSIATDGGSIELAHSTEGFYYYNGQVYRGNMIRCNYVNDKYNAVALEQLSDGRYNYLIIDNHGAVLANVITDDLREPEKRKAEIELTDAEVKSMTPDAFSLQRFANIGVLSEPNVESDKEQRSLQKRRQECCKALIDNGVLDKDGNVNIKSENLLPAIIQSSMIMNPELTEDKTDIKMVVKSTSQPKIEQQPTVTPKQQKAIERKVEQVKRKRTIKNLDEQITELEQMTKNLRERAKENPSYYETLNTVETFKQYVQLVKEIQQNKNVANPKNVVLDAKTVDSIVLKLKRQMKEIFGNGVQFMSDEEIGKNLSDNAQLSANLHNNSENLTFNNIDKAIESGEWNQEALDELNNLINDIENGSRILNRLSQRELVGCTRGGKRNVAASCICAISTKTDSKTEKSDEFKQAEKQQRILEKWAESEKIWIGNTNEHFEKTHTQIAEGGEATVYYDGSGEVVKCISLDYFITPQLLLDRISLHNTLFPETNLDVIGFGKDKDGNFKIIIKQKFIDIENIEKATEDEIQKFAKSIGLKLKNAKNWTYVTNDNSLYVSDLHDENVIKLKKNGKTIFYVIDADIRLNTPNLKQGGKRIIDNSITNSTYKIIQSNQQFAKVDGTIYGYESDGKIVINKDKFRLDTPVHEYTHLWDNALIEAANKGNEGAKALWQQGVELMKQTSEWDKVVNDSNYANIKDDENKVASEVHSRLSGMIAAGKMIEIAAKEQKKQTKKGLWARLIDWFKKFKDWTLGNIFNMSADKAKEVTLDQFLNAPVADFFMGTDPRNIGKTDYSQPEQTKQDVVKNESLFVIGDTVTYGTYNDGKYNVVDKKAEVIGITDKGVKIKVGDTIKTVNEQFLSLLYHAKPSSILGNENNVLSIEKKLGEPISYIEALARYIADSDIAISENAAKDVTGINKDFVSKDGKAFDTIADEFKGAYTQYANINSQKLENTISDLLKNNGSRLELEKYAAQLHFEQQDNDWQAEVNAIENSLNNEEYNNEILNPDELSDEEYAEIFKDEMLSDEELEKLYSDENDQIYEDYISQRTKELAESNIDDSEGYEDYLNRERLDEEEAQRKKLEGYQEPDDNAEMALIAETLAKLRGQIQDDGLDIINDNQALNVLSNVEKKKKEGVILDTFKPAISEYSINDHRISFIDEAQKEGKDYKYIYDMYTSFDAFEYVKQGKLKPNQEVYIAFGHIGQYTVKGQLKRIWKPVFLVKDEKGEYQLIGTLSDSSVGDPDTAEKLSRAISNIYKNEKDRIEYRKITATKTTDTFKAGEEKGFFLIKQKNGNYLTTKVSKILNGSLPYSGKKQRSLKDVKIDKTGKTVNQSIDNGEQRPVRIGFYDGGTKLQDNMTADERAVSEIEGFRSKKSKQKGHIVLIINKPNGLYQLIPLHVSMFKDLMNNSYNHITKQIDEILKEAWNIYTSNESQKSKDSRLIEKGGIVSRLRNILHMSNMQVFFNLDDNFNQSIRINVNDKKEWTKSSPQNYEEFATFFKEQLADCFVNINSEILNNNAILNSYIQADVFKTNLESMEFRNAFFTVKPIDSDGNFLDSKKDMPESHDLKESDLSSDFKPFKVYKEGRMEYFVCKDLEGNFGVYSKKIGTKLYKKDNVNTDYRITTQMRMIEYALQKNGIKSGENKDYITTVTIEGSDNPIEVLAHPTVMETEYYNTETWEKVTDEVKTDKNKQKGETKQESVQKSEQSSEQKTNISDFANDNFTSKFVEFESGLDYTDGVSKLGQMLDSVNIQDISNYINGNHNLIDSSSLNKLKMLSKAFGDDMIKSFIDFKKQYNVTQTLNDLMEAIDFDDDDIEVDNEKVKEIFEKNKNNDLEKASNEVDNSCNIFDF